MNKMWKKAIATLLVVVMVGGAAPIEALAEMDWPTLPEGTVSSWVNDGMSAVKSAAAWLGDKLHGLSLRASAATKSGSYGANGNNVRWSLDTVTGVLTISGSGAMKDCHDNIYTSTPWYSDRKSIKSVVINNGVTSIGSGAFFDCEILRSITIPDSVTSIGKYAFACCWCLASVTLPDGVTSIGEAAFDNCASFIWITIPDSVTSIGAFAFSGCKRLRSITIPDGVTSISDDTFCACTSLTSVMIPDSVMSIGAYAFSQCHNLTSITIPAGVTSFGRNAFRGCIRMTSIMIPDSVTSIDEAAFYDCPCLTNVLYAGSKAQWHSIKIGYSNAPLLDATIHYNVDYTQDQSIQNILESIQYISSMPCLSEEDAILFLTFLFNQNYKKTDLSGSIYLKLLTGQLYNSMSADEVRGLIMDFLFILQKLLNERIAAASNQNTLFNDVLVHHLEQELGNRDPGSEIVEAVKAPVIRKVKDTLKLGFFDAVGYAYLKAFGINLSEDILDKADDIWQGITTVQSIKPTVERFYNRLAAGVSGACFVYAQELVGRYSYFNAYLQNRNSPDYRLLNDAVFQTFSDATWTSRFIDLFSWVTGKNSWQYHRDDIDRWAEYCYQISEYAKKSEHNYQTEVIQPTCVSPGYTHRWCTTCDYDVQYNNVEPLGHNYQIQSQMRATCTQQGCRVDVCSRCGDTMSTYEDAWGHRPVSSQVVAPTCTQGGYTIMRCSCGSCWADYEMDALGHSYVFTTIEPTENTQGYVQGVCSVCHQVIYKDFVPATGHQFTAQVTEPTCSSGGYTEYTCSECGYSYRDNLIPKREHQFVLDSSIPATCTQIGKNTFVCLLCGTEQIETSEMRSHDYSYSVTRQDATCETDGYIKSACICGDEQTEILPAVGHSWTLKSSVEATCGSDGSETYRCTVCGEQYTSVIPMPYSDHDYVCVEERQGQCTTIGYRLYSCSHCRKSYYELTSTFSEHQFGDWVLSASNEAYGIYRYTRTCSVCGLVDTETRKDDNAIYIIAENGWIVPGSKTHIAVLNNDEEITDLCAAGLSLQSDLGTFDENGSFVAGSESGTATIECLCGDIVVAVTTVQIVVPETIRFLNSVDTMYYNAQCSLIVQAEFQDHLFYLNASALQFNISNDKAGQLDDLLFTICSAKKNVSSVTIQASVLDHPEIQAEYSIQYKKRPAMTGDISDNGAIDLRDVTILVRFLAGGWNAEIEEPNADVNRDGEINLKDAVILRRYLAGGWGVELK